MSQRGPRAVPRSILMRGKGGPLGQKWGPTGSEFVLLGAICGHILVMSWYFFVVWTCNMIVGDSSRDLAMFSSWLTTWTAYTVLIQAFWVPRKLPTHFSLKSFEYHRNHVHSFLFMLFKVHPKLPTQCWLKLLSTTCIHILFQVFWIPSTVPTQFWLKFFEHHLSCVHSCASSFLNTTEITYIHTFVSSFLSTMSFLSTT